MRTRGSVSEGSEDIMRTRGSVSEGSEDIMRTRGSVPEGSEDIMRTRGSVSEGSEDIMRTRGSVSEGSEDIMRTRGSVSEGSEDIMRTRGSVSEGSEDIMRTRGSVSEGSEDIMRTRGSVPEGSEDIMRTRGSVSVLHLSLMLLLLCWEPTEAIHPDCALVAQHMRAEEQCNQILKEEETNRSSSTGCPTVWDDIRCWSRAAVGQVVSVSCANVSQLFANNQGYIYRNCTEDGWSEAFPPYENACEFAEDKETEPETTYFSNFKQVYTAGYATSLISLISAIFVFTVFRKFHCTRNYIHINLFFSFILRASAVFIKDGVLFSDENLDHCFMSTTSCKSAVAFFQFSILANYFWLLVEGMYLQTLLALTFVFQKKYFWWYILIGWGLPTTIISAWILTRNFYDNKGCWDDTDVDFVWWIIKAPITASLLVNFIIFINVIRILVQKLTSPGVGGNDTSHFKRLAKSTLLLIPLFGMHYMLFAFLPEATGAEARLFIELGVGSFQGFGVALLYCFLNGEVQAELKKRFWKWQTQNYLRYSKRRRTLFTESSTVTQISVLDKSSPKDQPGSETQALTHSVTATPNNVSTV